ATGEADISVEAEISDVLDTESNEDEPDATTKLPLPKILLLMGLLSKHIHDQGLIISTNNYSRLIINKIRKHALIPNYPATKDLQSLKNPAEAKVWHCSYTCTSIKYCLQINQQLLLSEASGIPFDNFNEVDVQYFKFLWRHQKHAYQNLGPDNLLK
ncbi:hypothetical protein BJX76DRAFT_344692, partial [Aspergillus varians]